MLHRDLKPANVLVTSNFCPVICDFGLSRTVSQPLREYTNKVSSLGYRAPELLFGETSYSIGVDLWAVGCIFAELLTGFPLFNVKSELELIFKLCSVLGTPCTESFPALASYYATSPAGIVLPKNLEGPRLSEVLVELDSEAIDLISRFLAYNPNKRPSSFEALQHPFFTKSTKG